MTLNRSSWILVIFTLFFFQVSHTQNIDSLLEQRDQKFQEYTQFKENLNERTWINLVNLSNLANDVIELDNQIVEYYNINGGVNNNAYKSKAEDLNLEVSLLKREAEIQKSILDERQFLFNTLLMIIGGFTLLLIGLFIFAIDRHIRFRNTKMELERTWAGEIEIPKVSTSEQEFIKVNKEIRSLSAENTKLKDQVIELMNKIREKEDILDEELNSRKQLKDEIRNLITQIKSQ